jgi:hypothetical protein
MALILIGKLRTSVNSVFEEASCNVKNANSEDAMKIVKKAVQDIITQLLTPFTFEDKMMVITNLNLLPSEVMTNNQEQGDSEESKE